MPPKTNPLKLNKLQLRTLVLLQVLGRDERSSMAGPEEGAVTITQLPQVHGDHVHVGEFTVSGRDASGFANPAVWVALARKGLARHDASGTVLTAEGLAYDTGLADRLTAPSDH
ncbi:MAG: hypothetical protein HOK98_14315 [Rhodospirillaceae bacterium]|jgi:hypothetical protein|nr:hypothetical protein [Rhodospirillaceae bacterium]MBT7361894.1 hypothetical protein [Rhodospirillaceae bacterium]